MKTHRAVRAQTVSGLWTACMLMLSLILASPSGADNRAVKSGDNISIHYTGKLEDGTVFDKSEGRDPLKFQVGTPGIIKGMNDGVMGMKVGEKKTLKISPAEGYGERDDKMTFDVPLDKLPKGIKAGERLMSQRGDAVVVKEVKKDVAVLDANHFLAGKTLIFDVTLVSID